MTAAAISEVKISSWRKFCDSPAATPKTPPVRVVATSAHRRPILLASQTQAGPAGTPMILPRAAIRPRWPLLRASALAMLGNRVAVRPASVLSTTLTPVRVSRLRQRWGTCAAWASASTGAGGLVTDMVGFLSG
jgi:hypothetical protein